MAVKKRKKKSVKVRKTLETELREALQNYSLGRKELLTYVRALREMHDLMIRLRDARKEVDSARRGDTSFMLSDILREPYV